MIDPQAAISQFDAYAGSYDEAVNQSLGFLGVKVDYFTRVKAAYLSKGFVVKSRIHRDAWATLVLERRG